MSGPRNRKAFSRAQRERAAIRAIWLELVARQPFERVTAEGIRRRLPFRLARRTVSHHMERIRLEAILAEPVAEPIGGPGGDSSNERSRL
jgi:hypothetical protein